MPQEKFASAQKVNGVSTEDSSPSQRRYFRVAVDFPLSLTVAEGEPVVAGAAEDLGGGGMRVTTKGEISPGQAVALHFALPGDAGEMLVRGRVVLSFFDASKRHYAHGVAFTQIAEPDQKKIVEYIHEIQQRARA